LYHIPGGFGPGGLVGTPPRQRPPRGLYSYSYSYSNSNGQNTDDTDCTEPTRI